MLNDATLRKSIIASIIASLFVIIFIKPILDSIWHLVSWLGAYFYEGFSNAVYRNAALGQRDWVAVISLELFVSVICGTIFGFVLVSFIAGHSDSKIVEAIKKKRKSLRMLIIPMAIIMLFTSIMILVSVRTDLQLNTSFNQRLNVLSPHITELRYKELVSDWALMQNRQNYEKIVEEMEKIALKNQIQLPKLLIE